MKRTFLAWLSSFFLLIGFALPPARGQDGQPPPRMAIGPSRNAPQQKPEDAPSHMVAVPYAVGLLGAIGVLVVVCMPSRKHA